MVNFLLNISDLNKWKKGFQKSFLFITLLGLYVPLICFILLSFNSPSQKGNVSSQLGSWNNAQNYVSFFTDPSSTGNMSESLMNSLIIALTSIPISLVIGFFTALSIWKNHGKGKNSTFLFCNVTISSPDIVQAIAFSILFATLIIPLGINMGFFTVILTHIALQIPYVIIFLYPKLNKLNISLLYASYDLNFNFMEAIVHVFLPVLFPNIMGAILLAFTISFDDYIITNLIRGNVSTISSELYSMRTGIKVWASVFGSLIVVAVTFFILVFNFYKVIKKQKNV